MNNPRSQRPFYAVVYVDDVLTYTTMDYEDFNEAWDDALEVIRGHYAAQAPPN